MSEEQKNFLKSNWLTLANLIVLLTLTFRAGVIMTSLEDGINQNAEKLDLHKIDTSVHMRLEDKLIMFLPRTEFEVQMASLKSQLDRIEEKLDEK